MGPAARLALLIVALAGAACTTTEETLDPAQLGPSQAATQPAAPATAEEGASGDTAAAPSQPPVAGSVRVRVDPIVGAPTAANGPVTAQLGSLGQQRGFTVVPAGDASSTHILKGYFSASPEGGSTTIYYVWDVMDAAGNRVHRFSGQQKVDGGQGWSSVDEAALNAIADKTATDFAAWIGGRQG